MDQVQHLMYLWVIDSHGAYSNITLMVNVTDINNNPPVPNSTQYHGQVQGKDKRALHRT